MKKLINIYKYQMKIPKILILILLLSVPLNFLLAESKTKILKPKNADSKISVIVSGKSRAYYPLQTETPSIITVKGPGKLRVITRVQFTHNKKSSLDCRIYYRIDGAGKNSELFEDIERCKSSVYKNSSLGLPGKGKDIILLLGSGEHTLEFWRASEKPNVAARYIFTKLKKKKIDWVSLSPLLPNEPIDLISRENVIHYYRFSKSKPLKVKITGPTVLRILTRAENHHHMKGRINYRLRVKEDGIVKNTFLLNSIRSEITTYRKDGAKVPGKAKELIIDVPDGTHVYEIIPLDKDKNTILGRILFPKKDIKLEERI